RTVGSGVGFFLGLHVDGVVALRALLRHGFGGLFFIGVFHAFLEAFYGTAQVFAHVADFLGAEHQVDNDQNNQPVPDTETTHDFSYAAGAARLSQGRGPPIICTCRWSISCPPSMPVFITSLKPPSWPGVQPFSCASCGARAIILPNHCASSGCTACMETMCCFGI